MRILVLSRMLSSQINICILRKCINGLFSKLIGRAFTAAIHLNQKIELNQKKYILYYAYLNGGRWEEIGSYNIDGKNYFERRWEGPATVESYKIDGNNAEVTLKFPETSIFKEGKQWLVLSIFPYDHFTTGATLLDYMFYVNFQQ